jgi:hypothetical protein
LSVEELNEIALFKAAVQGKKPAIIGSSTNEGIIHN